MSELTDSEKTEVLRLYQEKWRKDIRFCLIIWKHTRNIVGSGADQEIWEIFYHDSEILWLLKVERFWCSGLCSIYTIYINLALGWLKSRIVLDCGLHQNHASLAPNFLSIDHNCIDTQLLDLCLHSILNKYLLNFMLRYTFANCPKFSTLDTCLLHLC
jgi:hypothetical protein